MTTRAEVQGQKFEIPTTFALDRPAEDSLGQVMKQLGEQIPDNAQFSREEHSRGEQKLFVGGQPYYCQVSGSTMTWEDEAVKVSGSEKTWRSIDVPVDGVVKEETICTSAGLELFHRTIVLLAHGRRR